MEEFADGVVNLMDELGIKKAPVYGYHTGGICALALGLRHPDRFTVAIMNGYIQLEKDEVNEILQHYFPKVVPDWSGSPPDLDMVALPRTTAVLSLVPQGSGTAPQLRPASTCGARTWP
jgi:pimeloyl-ACP methyl ester carboxylesterase